MTLRWHRTPKGVSKPPIMKPVPWWDGESYRVARRLFVNLYLLTN